MFVIGSGFAPGTTVTVGGIPAGINSVSPTVINCTTPAGTVGQVQVVVTTPNGCAGTGTYTYL